VPEESRTIETKIMNFPPPTDRQARILWMSVTALGIGVILALLSTVVVGFGWVAQQLSSVLLPLAVAAIIAFLLDPVVDCFQRRGIPRIWSIILVFVLAVGVLGVFLAIVIPRIVSDVGNLIDNIPKFQDAFMGRFEEFHVWVKTKLDRPEMENPMTTIQALWMKYVGDFSLPSGDHVKDAGRWIISNVAKAASLLGLLVGFALVPVYVFYFLLEKTGIAGHWTDYLPVQEPAIKNEIVFFINSVNDALIVFFRGQILVAMCVGALTAIGFSLIGLNYGLLLGVMTGMLGIIPYLGVMMSFVPAVIIGIVQFGDWRVGLVVAVFATVQFLEGMVISPKIIGDRVGMHPLTIIIAVITGTTLLGGIVGGILAIPITAVLRALMFRYVWVKRDGKKTDESAEITAEA